MNGKTKRKERKKIIPVMPAVCPETRRSSLASFSVHKAIKASSNPVINISSLKSTAATRASVAYILKKDVSLLGFRDPATIVAIRFEQILWIIVGII